MIEDRDDEIFYQETDRAEAERKQDALNAAVYTPQMVLNSPPPKGNILLSGYTLKLTCQNRATFLEDVVGCEHYSNYEPHDVREGAAILREIVKRLSDATSDYQSGSTLTLSLCWLSQTEAVHILTAQLGISRAFLCNAKISTPNEATIRLTREHTLLRDDERACRTQGFVVSTQNDQGFVANTQGKLVARQIGKELHPGKSQNYLTMTRSLGDKVFHENSPVFSHEPSISLASYKKEDAEKIIVVHVTHGLSDYVSDEEISAELLKPDCKAVDAIKGIKDLAHRRGSKANMSLVIGFLDRLHHPGDLMMQFVADGHGKKEGVYSVTEYINHNLSFVFRDVFQEFKEARLKKAAEPLEKRLKH